MGVCHALRQLRRSQALRQGSALRKDIRTRFPDKVREEAKKSRAQRSLRRTARAAWICVPCPSSPFDSAETKDIDRRYQPDHAPRTAALSWVSTSQTFSNYVKPGTELDNEAFQPRNQRLLCRSGRADAAQALSNGICSLNEDELRLAFSCLMHLDKDGNLIGLPLCQVHHPQPRQGCLLRDQCPAGRHCRRRDQGKVCLKSSTSCPL